MKKGNVFSIAMAQIAHVISVDSPSLKSRPKSLRQLMGVGGRRLAKVGIHADM